MGAIWADRVWRVARGIIPALGGIGFGIWLLARTNLQFSGDLKIMVFSIMTLAAVLISIAAVVLILRYALGPPWNDNTQSAAGVVGELQGFLAPRVVTIGTLSILALSLGLIGVFGAVAVYERTLLAKLDTLLMGVFSTVLPVFATWVGTVLAFVYAKENFKAAADASRPAGGDRRPVGEVMRTSFQKFPVKDLAELEAKDSKTVLLGFGNVSRLPVMHTDTGLPLAVIRKPSLANFIEGNSNATTMKNFLDAGTNRADSQRFGWVAASATVDEARDILSQNKLYNLFVTATGRKDEGVVLGCVFDDEILSTSRG